MSDSDSFINEVSEEVRRDRLFKLMRRWGWLPVLLIVSVVGGATYIEWSKARNQAAAEVLGTDILAAIQIEDPAQRAAAYGAIETDGDNSAVLALLASGDAVEAGNISRAVADLQNVAQDMSLSDAYRHLAELKLLMIRGDDIAAPDRMQRLAAIAAPGAPYRLLAEEQMAITEISTGETGAALQRLTAILADGEVTPGLQRRVSQLIVALGGDLAPT